MIPEISEFSYGFALTNEVVGWTELSSAPIFPSLLEEGKVGGGYDVKLDRPGAPLYLQFKRSECMARRSAREYRAVRDQGGHLNVPFYRFPITEANKSDQHELLLALDTAPNHVFYAAPRFHRLGEINDAWHSSSVASRSIFISPNVIGSLDDERHTVAFDRSRSWLCSEPQPIEASTAREVLRKIQNQLKDDDRPLRERLPSLVNELQSAEQRGRERIIEKQRRAAQKAEMRSATQQPFDGQLFGYEIGPRMASVLKDQIGQEPEPNPPATRDAKSLDPELQLLREASDIAARVFDAQLIIVQPNG